MTTEGTSWGGTSGLVDDVDGKIISAEFTYDNEYADGNACIMRMELEIEGQDEPEVLKLSTGKGWEPAAKGTEMVREDGRAVGKGPSNQCAYMRVAIAACGVGAEDVLLKRGEVNEAKVWDGLVFHWEREDYWPYTIPQAERTAENSSSRLVPTAFLGEDGGAAKKPAKKAPAKAAAKDADEETVEATASVGGDAGGVPVKTRMQLKKLAKDASDHSAFVEAAFSEIDGIEDNEELYGLVMDESDEGIFVTSNA